MLNKKALLKLYKQNNLSDIDINFFSNYHTDNKQKEIDCFEFKLNTTLYKKIKRLAKKDSFSISNFLRSIFQIFLHKYTKQEVVEIFVADNSKKDLFANMFPVRLNVQSNTSFKDLLEQENKVYNDFQTHATSFLDWVKTLFDSNQSSKVIFAELKSTAKLDFQNIISSFEKHVVNSTLGLVVKENASNINLFFLYDKSSFDPNLIKSFTASLMELIKSASDDVNEAIENIEIISKTEKKKITTSWAGTEKLQIKKYLRIICCSGARKKKK